MCIETVDLQSFRLKLCDGVSIKMNFGYTPFDIKTDFDIWIHEFCEYALYCTLVQMEVSRKFLDKEISRLCNNGNTISQMISHIGSACHTESYVKIYSSSHLESFKHFYSEEYCSLILTRYKV